MKEEALRLDKVTRIVGKVPVLENINLHLFRGEVLGVLCLNDYGQQELVNLLQQNHPLLYGKIYINDVLVNSYEHSSMSFNRIAVIDRKSMLVDDLTVSDNIFVLRRGFQKHIISRAQLDRQLQQFVDELDVDIRGSQRVGGLSTYEKCVVELLRAVVLGVRLIVVRNISNYISTADLTRFQNLMRYYCTRGFSFLYICHHHEEAFKVCDNVAILQHTKIRKVVGKSQFTRSSIEPYYLDIYRTQSFTSPPPLGRGVLRFDGVRSLRLRDLSLTVEAGECVVLLDFDHTALEDVMAVMTGKEAVLSGGIFLDGQPYSPGKARRALRNGVAFVPQYPATMLFRDMSYLDNLCFLVGQKPGGLRMGRKMQRSVLREYGPKIGPDIHSQDITQVSLESLYNLVYYRVHLARPKVVFCVQPFSDADMQLRLHIIQLIKELKLRGIAVVILAVNLSDTLMAADRLLIVQEGQMLHEFARSEFHDLNADATVF